MAVKLKPLAEQVIVITGASSGIGLATLGVGLEPRPGFGPEGRLVRGVVEVHDRQH